VKLIDAKYFPGVIGLAMLFLGILILCLRTKFKGGYGDGETTRWDSDFGVGYLIRGMMWSH